ncbi:hypothetical protein [Arthrobacter psychrolactophilus]
MAFSTLVLLGMREQFNHTITFGYVAAVLLAPLWLPKLRKYRGALPVVIVGAISVGSGFWLLEYNSSTHVVEANSLVNNVVLLLGLLLSFGVVVWARELMPDWVIGLAYGLGLLMGVSRTGMALVNPWKFGFSIPVIIVVLSVASCAVKKTGQRRRVPEILSVLALAIYSGLNDSRSLFAMLGLALVLTVWQLIPRGRTRRRSMIKTVFAFAVLVIVAYEGGTSLLVDGYLGEAAQQRTVAQIDVSGSVLLGGRPEMAASLALFQSNPLGFGLGSVPSLEDVAVAKTGMAGINYQPNNGYVERYMLGDHFELHSSTADFWVLFGLPGLLLAIMIIAIMLRWIVVAVVHRQASSLVLFLSILTLWNLLFSPLYTSITSMALALGLTVIPKIFNGELRYPIRSLTRNPILPGSNVAPS